MLLLLAFTAASVVANGRHDIDGNVIASLSEEELAVTNSGKLGDRPASIGYWSDKSEDERDRSTPPYPFPSDRVYRTSGGPKEGMINVHLVPHSHDDTGWQVTVDQYFAKEVFYIIDTMTTELTKNPDRKFIYVETAFFARWWEESSDTKRTEVKRLVATGQLEFINGGWCMHDEAAPLWNEMVDQTTRGHQFLLKNFGSKANPRGTWQIDPFGHSNTQAWLLGAEAGMESLYWGRMDWQDRQMRFDADREKDNFGFEWVWQGSESLGASAQVFAGNLFGMGAGGYATWFNFDHESNEQVNDVPQQHDYNVDQWVDKFVQDAQEQAAHTKTSHQMWACGTDFQYQNADRWYSNLDKMIHYVNMNGTVNAFYSTPSLYTDAKRAEATAKNIDFELRTDDVMPLGDNAHDYWSGYFTSRPALKRQVRFATNLLAAARQLEIITRTTKAQVNRPTKKASPVVGSSWTDSLEGTVGVATHHDGMSGTERQSVTNDYEERISESAIEVEAGISLSLSQLLDVDRDTLRHCACNAGGNCLNMSMCDATSRKQSFTVAAWNVHGWSLNSHVLRLPVSDGMWSCVDSSGAEILTQYSSLDARTRSLPLLYLNKFNMTAAEIKEAERELANDADGVLTLELPVVPAVGLATFKCAMTPKMSFAILTEDDIEEQDITVVENEIYSLRFENNVVTSITNKRSNLTTKLSLEWGWYNSSVGGCTVYPTDDKTYDAPCSGQKSGAYIFRPNSSELFWPGPKVKPTLEVVRGELFTEIRQSYSSWASHVIRLYRSAEYVEVEWTAGPIPVETPWFPDHGMPNVWGKELVLKYSTGLASKSKSYTDSNGREMVQRIRDRRGPSYPAPYNISEPVAGNYYPVGAMASLDDGLAEFAVLVDASLGAASIEDGSLEFMVHRRVQDDDSRGVQEPLNETMCGCNDVGAEEGKMGAHGHEGDGGCDCQGLTVRGRQWLVFDEIEKAHALRRHLAELLSFPPTTAIAPFDAKPRLFSAVSAALPANVKLVTLTSNYAEAHGGAFLLRFAHLYQSRECALAQPVTIDLQKIFAESGLRLTEAKETTLTANAPVSTKKNAHKWTTVAASAEQQEVLDRVEETAFITKTAFEFPMLTIRPMEVRTFLAKFDQA